MRQFLAALVIFLAFPTVSRAQGRPPYEKRITDAATIAARTKKFAIEMKNLGFKGDIRSCRLMVWQAVGVKGGNISYGAICTVNTNRRLYDLMMCDDDLVGHYALTNTFVMSEEAVAKFTKQNCYGG
jgi:hypothetical protein